MAKLFTFIKEYKKIELPIKNAIASEFFIQTVNATFMNILPLYMTRKGFTDEEIALFITFRFIGVFILALPLGKLIKGRKVMPLFYLSNICIPIFGIAIILSIAFHLKLLTLITLVLWGASFTFMQIPIFPFILRNAKKANQTAAISLSYSTWSFGGIVSGIVIAILDYINPVIFDEQFILLLFSIVGFGGIFFLRRIKNFDEMAVEEEPIKNKPRVLSSKTDWGLVMKALWPTLIIATGAGLTIPFISLFFDKVHHLGKGGFSLLSFVASLLVAYFAMLVPKIKEKIGYKIAIPTTQSLAVISLVALATTQYFSELPIAVVIASVCYLLRQPLMNMAGPMTSELVLNYVGRNNREITSALTSAIWSGSWVLSGFMVTVLFAYNFSFGNVFLITSLLYALGVILYYLLILDYNKREEKGLIENKITYLFIFTLCFTNLKAQLKQFAFSKGNCQLYNGNIYSYGLLGQKQAAVFCIYKLDFKLKILDSLIVETGKSNAENYLQIYSDTLHDYLNVYLQKKEKKTVTLLRFNKKFELIATIESIDIARLNNTSMFSYESLYFKNTVYSIKTESDTSGKQFYLNKYLLKSEAANFDYEFKWQFPFERKNIHSAHIFYADKKNVFLYVTVEGGTKTGQWVLKLNSENGKLEKATKLNDKGETNSYQFGDFFADKNYKSISLIGQKYSEAQFSPHENKLAISNAVSTTVYYLEIDSLGEISTKQDFKIPVNDIKTGVKKTSSNYILRLYDFSKSGNGGFSFTGDIFKSINSNLCYLYSNTSAFNVNPTEDKLVMEKNSVSPNLLIEQYYTSIDKLDLNGKLCIDSLNQFDKLFYKPLTFPVKLQFKFDPEKNPIWLLSKHTTKKNGINFSFLKPVKKIYQLTTLEEMSEANNPVFTDLSSESFIISSQPEEGKYQLNLYNW